MLALKPWRYGCALVSATLLLLSPASAQDLPDPSPETAPEATDEPADPDEADSDLEEPDAAELDAILRMDILQQASDIEEILITGEKQNTLQDAPTSSTSFTAGDLQALRIEDIADLADYTPNLEINTAFAASNPTIFIRGIGLKDYNANAAGAVAVYQDGVNINSPAIQLGQLFDIDGIDVLRGPQGSVNGRNATAGAILIRSAMPDGEFGVQTSLTYGNYDYKEVEAAINVPLVEDMLSMRISGVASWRDGYTKNQCAGWNPEKHINPATGMPFRRVDEQSTRDLYFSLQPAGQWTFNPGSGEFEVGEVMIQRENGSGARNEFVFLNYDLALQETRNRQVQNVNVRENNSWVLAEDLRDPTGAVIATAGTKVAYMSTTMQFSNSVVDGICILQEPGKLATLDGELDPPQNAPPEWEEGYWDKTRIQPGLEDFAQLKNWTNNIDNWAARMVLLYEPLDNMEWMINVHGTQNRGDSAHLQMLGADSKVEKLGFFETGQNGFSENRAAIRSGFTLGEGVRSVKGIDDTDGLPGQGGGNPFSGFYNSDGIEFIDAWGINGRGFWDLGAFVVTLLYDYEWYDRVVDDEGDANPVIVFPAIWSDSAWQTTEELRIEGEEERFKWTAGFFFLYEQLRATNFFPATQNFRIEQNFNQKLFSWAPYANGEIDLVEEGVIPGIYELTLGLGVHYNQERKKFGLTSSAIASESLIEAQVLPKTERDSTWKEWTGDLQLSYTPFSNEYGTLLTYLKYGHGFKGGHFNAGLTISGGNDIDQQLDPVQPEFIDAVELGFRTRWLDDRIILNAAVFRYWYTDLQVFDITNEATALPIQQLLNGDANVLGTEVELRLRPAALLEEYIGPWSLLFPSLLNGSMGWLDTEFGDFVVTKAVRRGPRNNAIPTDFDYEGNRLVAAPEWNWSVIMEYEFPIFGWGALVPQYDFNYRSKTYLDPQMVDPISMKGYWLHNARIAYRTPDDRIELAFWVSNILEQTYKVDTFDLSREFNTILEVWGEPRTYGVTLSLNW